mmetsp:Transcript_56037/g.156122  ORF Transcript_56037/g.156122 Transcript_56037/m.156122 type:complete len:645 (+) Transcript_56037:168-2102(+)
MSEHCTASLAAAREEIKAKIRSACLGPRECEALFKQLGWNDQDVGTMFNKAQAYYPSGKFDSDRFVDWLFLDHGAAKEAGQEALPAPSIGVVRLDCDYTPAEGDIDHAGSYVYDVYYRVVPGLTFDMCRSGQLTHDVKCEFIEAIKYLDRKGVSAITGDCGFMMWFQHLARMYTTKPVFMSSLAQLPAVLCGIGSDEKVAVFTANSKTLEPMRGLIRDECHIGLETEKLVIVGCQDVPGFEAVAEGGKVDTQKVEPGIVAKAMETLRDNPNVRAILLECTEMPPYSDALRVATGLPVFDAITCSDHFVRSRLDNPRTGLNQWQASWDGTQEQYVFGKNLSVDDYAKVVNTGAGDSQEITKAVAEEDIPEFSKRQTAALGVLRLDYDVDPAVGSVDNVGTFAYPVIYRVVTGLTYEMCVEGKMPDHVQEEFIAAVKYFDDRRVSGITCDCSLAFGFQDMARAHATRPVFLSPIVQLPAVISAFARDEHILIVTESPESLRPMMGLVKEECGADMGEHRFFVVGVGDVEGFMDVLQGPKACIDEVSPRIVKTVMHKVWDVPTIRAIVMESTVLSPFVDAVKAACNLPVFDSISVCDLFMNGKMDNPLFGLQGWQRTWDSQQEKYVLGMNATLAVRADILHKCHCVS